MKYHKSRIPTVLAALLGIIPIHLGNAAQVYIGGGDNYEGSMSGYLNNPNGWTFVRSNVSGWYTNNFAVARADVNASLGSMRALFQNNNVFYETDYDRSTDFGDKVNIDRLRAGGFNVAYTTCNKNLDGNRIAALQWRSWRPVLFMIPPWQLSGNILNNDPTSVFDRSKIDICSGMATDGPMGYWNTNQGQMREGSYSAVKYARNAGKKSMVMLATYSVGTYYNANNLAASGQSYYNVARQCVLMHENNQAAPDLWAVSYYASQLEKYPVTPEKNADGSPAGTVTGVAYWLIKHLRGELASLDLHPAEGLVMGEDKKEENTLHHVARHDAPVGSESKTLRFNISNNDPFIDYAPVVAANIQDPNHQFEFAFSIGGKDCTKEMTEGGGLDMIRELRLMPGDKRELTLTVKRNKSVTAATEIESAMPSVQVSLHAHSTEMDRVIQTSKIEFKTEGDDLTTKLVLR